MEVETWTNSQKQTNQNQQSLSDKWYIIKSGDIYNRHLKEKENNIKNPLNEIVENFRWLKSNTDIQTQKTQRTSNKIQPKKSYFNTDYIQIVQS